MDFICMKRANSQWPSALNKINMYCQRKIPSKAYDFTILLPLRHFFCYRWLGATPHCYFMTLLWASSYIVARYPINLIDFVLFSIKSRMDYVDSLLKSCRTPHYKTRWRTERPPCCHHSVEECKQSTKLFTPNLTITNFICLWHITIVTLLNYCKLSCAKTLNRVFMVSQFIQKAYPRFLIVFDVI